MCRDTGTSLTLSVQRDLDLSCEGCHTHLLHTLSPRPDNPLQLDEPLEPGVRRRHAVPEELTTMWIMWRQVETGRPLLDDGMDRLELEPVSGKSVLQAHVAHVSIYALVRIDLNRG
jgi:hypothetical protein